MEHKAEVVEVRQVSDRAIAILARCCGDEITDSWHTLYDLENLERYLVEHPKRVAEHHAVISEKLSNAESLGHKVTKGHIVQGHCPHCGRGSAGTMTQSL